MITVHHLNNSRSQRILWLLEELGLDYEIVSHHRDPATRLAPDTLKAVHPLGKSPVIVDGGRTIIESGAIIDYLVHVHGGGRLAPRPDAAEYWDYVQWMHFAEGSAMLPLLMAMYLSRLAENAAPLWPRVFSEIANHMDFIEKSLDGREHFLRSGFSAADVQMSFVLEAAGAGGRLGDYPNCAALLARMQARPAYVRAVDRGGPYTLGR